MKLAFAVFVTVFAVIGGVVLVGTFFGHNPTTASSSVSDDREDVIDACQDSVKKSLKDPDSARFDDWTASPSALQAGVGHYADEQDYTASGMVNSKNGFGGYVGDSPFSCTASAHDGTIQAQAHPN